MNKWISVKDKLPELDVMVKVRTIEGDECEFWLHNVEGGVMWKFDAGGASLNFVKAWQPMQEASAK